MGDTWRSLVSVAVSRRGPGLAFVVHAGLGRSRSRGVVRVRETRKRGYRYTTVRRRIGVTQAEQLEDALKEAGGKLLPVV